MTNLNTIGGGFNYTTAGTQPAEKGVANARQNRLRIYDRKGDPSNIGRFEIDVYSFAEQGYNHPEGDFSQHSNGYAWSSLVTNRVGELVPAPVITNTAPATASGNFVGLHSAYIFGTLILGIGSASNAALFKQTSTTDPTPAAITFTPAGEICSLTPVLANGSARLAVGEVGQPVRLLSDASGTVATTMHSSTNSCWGIILSGINATDAGVPVMLMYCGTSIGTKATNATLTTAIVPTVPPTTVNAGGRAIGAVKPAGRAQRAYWQIPKVSNTSGALKYGAEALMDIMSTDMTGGDLLPHQSFYCPNGVLEAEPFRDGMLYHDENVVIYWDGEHEYNLGIFRRRVQFLTAAAAATTNTIDSDDRRKIRGLIVNGPECGVIYDIVDINGVIGNDIHTEMYNFETGSWHNVSQNKYVSVTPSQDLILTGNGGVGLSPDTRYIYAFINGSKTFYYTYIPRPGESLLWLNSLGSGGTFTAGIPSYSGGSIQGQLLGCRWWLDETPPGSLPGTNSIRRAPKVITEVEFGGNLDYGGAGVWTFQIQVQGRGMDGTTTYTAYDQTFLQGKPSADYKRKNPVGARANIQDVQLLLTAATSDGLAKQRIVQLVPFTIRGAYSKDGNPITELPEDVTQ